MSKALKVYLLSTSNRTCFFYLNEAELRDEKWLKSGIKIQFGCNYEQISYGSISLQCLPEVPNNSIGIAPLVASRMGLKENDEVFVTSCEVCSIQSLEISPLREEDYVILVSCKSILESHILNQVRVVAEKQVLPLYVFTNIIIDVEIGKIQSNCNYGQLEKFTEIIILHPSEKPATNINSFIYSDLQNNSNYKLNQLFHQVNNILEEITPSVRYVEESNIENIIKKVQKTEKKNIVNYEIKLHCLLSPQIPEKIKNNCVIVSHFDIDSVVGPYCTKTFVKVQKYLKKQNDAKENENVSVYCYLISLNDIDKRVAYCPFYIMKKLKLHVGSTITVEKAKLDLSLQKFSQEYFTYNPELFWSNMACIRENIKQTVINNIKCNYKLNSLIVGSLGSGKTFLLQDIAYEFAHDFIFYKFVSCKTLTGKKIETLQKFWSDCLLECACHEPSLLILDDLHSLTYVEEEEGEFKKFYSKRVVDLVTNCIKEVQNRYNLSVIASTTSTSQLSDFVSTHGPQLFENVHTVLEMSVFERCNAFEILLKNKSKNTSELNLNKLAESTHGYTIQDLNDLVERAIFNSLLRLESPSESPSCLIQADFESVLSETVPLSLHGVKLKDNIEKKWEDVGGMAEPKKILTEVFMWPSKYPKLLESCPLRLQRGVLLYGAPGTGKTILAGALASKCGLNFISVKGPEVLSKYVGASEEGVRNLFQQAQKTNPCLLFFDEFDSLAPKRGHDSTGVTDRVVNQLLTQLDGVEALNGVWVLAATSRPDLIDPALLRPGRLDKMVFCEVPDKNDRLSILETLSKSLGGLENINLAEIARKTDGYTGADIQAILYNAQMCAIKENMIDTEEGNIIKINQNHLLSALSETKPSLTPSEKLKYDKIYEKFLNSRKRNHIDNYAERQKITFA